MQPCSNLEQGLIQINFYLTFLYIYIKFVQQHHKHHTDNRHPNQTILNTPNNNICSWCHEADILYSFHLLFLSNTIYSKRLNIFVSFHQHSRHSQMCYLRNTAVFHQTTLNRDRYICHAINDPNKIWYSKGEICVWK